MSAQVPKEAQGRWFLVNTLSYINIKADGSFIDHPSGTAGKIKFMDESLASWSKGAASGGATLDGDRLLFTTATDVIHFWIGTLEYRRLEPDSEKSLVAVIDKLAPPATAAAKATGEVQTALRSQAAKAAANIDRRAVEMKMRENLMLLDNAAGNYLLNTGDAQVSFAKLKASSSMPKDFAPVDGEDYSKLVFGQGVRVLRVTSQNGVTASINP